MTNPPSPPHTCSIDNNCAGCKALMDRLAAERASDINATARRIILYMLDRGPIAPSSELTHAVRQELSELEQRLTGQHG